MKKIMFVLLVSSFVFGGSSKAQDKEPPITLSTEADGSFSFEKVFEISKATKEELYDRIKLWVTSNLKSTDNNMSFDDAKKETIASSTIITLLKNSGEDSHLYFKISFIFKEAVQSKSISIHLLFRQVQHSWRIQCAF